MALLLLAVLCCGGLQSYASKTNLMNVTPDVKQDDPTIVINDGLAEVVDIGSVVAEILVADPMIVDVISLQTDKLYIVGMEPGTTNIMVLDGDGNVVKRFNVHVTIDTTAMQNTIDQFFPGEDIKIEALRAQYILSGTVSSANIAQQVQNLVTHLVAEVEEKDRSPDEAVVNLLQVRGESQVSLRVRIMEVSRTLFRERGTNTRVTDLGTDFNGNINNSTQQGLAGNLFGQIVQTSVNQTPAATFGLVESFGAFGPIDVALNLLEDAGLAKILAEPNLTAVSGEQAGFLAGGEFPVPSGRDNQGNIEVTFRQFGVTLNFMPVVVSNDRINLQLETEVSSISRTNQVTLNALQIPGLDIRRASTTVEMASGASLMIGGLLRSETIDGLTGIPGMTDAPVIGDLIASESFRRNETELVILVTPYLVRPFADKDQGDEIPMPAREKNYLADAFSANIRRTYGRLQMPDLIEEGEGFGYILD